jgi:hypothetical protein
VVYIVKKWDENKSYRAFHRMQKLKDSIIFIKPIQKIPCHFDALPSTRTKERLGIAEKLPIAPRKIEKHQRFRSQDER